MTKEELHRLLTLFRQEQKTTDEVIEQLTGVSPLSHATIDINRKKRTGQPETIYGEGKSVEQIIPIVERLRAQEQVVLITRLTEEKGQRLSRHFPKAEWYPSNQDDTPGAAAGGDIEGHMRRLRRQVV